MKFSKLSNLLCKFPESERLWESYSLIQEILLSPENAFEIKGSHIEGTFQSLNEKHTYLFQNVSSEELRDVDLDLGGNTWFISFFREVDDPDNWASFTSKEGKNNLIKIYSTLYKIILDFCKIEKPDRIAITALDKSGYFPIYSDLTKSNKIPGYHRTRVFSYGDSKGKTTGILLTKNRKQ